MKQLPYAESWIDKLRWSAAGRLWHKIDDKVIYPIKKYFCPCHDTVRRSIPRSWVDSDYLIVHTNFAIITEFVEQELGSLDELAKLVDFHTKDPDSKSWLEFYQWLGRAYNYITVERPMLEKQMDVAYPSIDKDIDSWLDQIKTKESYESKYGEVNRLEKLIEDRDTATLIGLITHRKGMWT